MDALDVGLVTSHSPESLPFDATIYVQIIPYNSAGDTLGCPLDSFKIYGPNPDYCPGTFDPSYVGIWSKDVETGDLDGDGDIDMVAAVFNNDEVRVYVNNGSQTFSSVIVDSYHGGVSSVHIADLDNDQDLDIVATAESSDDLTWYRNDGGLDFTEITIDNSYWEATDVFAFDVDGDLDLDLVATSAQLGAFTWLNDGAGDFSNKTEVYGENDMLGCHADDIDGDGDVDVLLAGTNHVILLENNLDSFITHIIDSDFGGSRSIHAADFDGDGDLDIVGAARSDDEIAWWENMDSLSFFKHLVDDFLFNAEDVYSGDIDGDGDNDVLGVTRANNGYAQVYYNDGSGEFDEVSTGTGHDYIYAIHMADVDQDGDNDFVTAAQSSDNVKWYSNACLPPVNCSQLISPVDQQLDVSVHTKLHWIPHPYQVDGYRLTVGTSPGTGDIIDDLNVGNVTSYDPGTLPFNSTIYVTIVPFNNGIDATGCLEEHFVTKQGENCIKETRLLEVLDSEDLYGHSVGIHGDYAIVGSPGDDDQGLEAGAAYIYERVGGQWILMTKILASDASVGDRFGTSVAIDEEYVIVGAHLNDDPGVNSGAAYVFRLNGAVWVEQEKIVPLDPTPNKQFGKSVDISNGHVIAGAPGDENNGPWSGAAYIYQRNGTNWIQNAKLTVSDADNLDMFGSAVALNDTVALIGAHGEDAQGLNAGAAYVFSKSGSNWVEQQKLSNNDGASHDMFGYALAVSDSIIAVGAPGANIQGMNSGSVSVYKRSENIWEENSQIIPDEVSGHDMIGSSISIDQPFIAIGAPGNDETGVSSGAVYVYRAIGDTIIRRFKIVPDNQIETKSFGIGLAITEQFMVVGTPLAQPNVITTGAATIIDYRLENNLILGEIDSPLSGTYRALQTIDLLGKIDVAPNQIIRFYTPVLIINKKLNAENFDLIHLNNLYCPEED